MPVISCFGYNYKQLNQLHRPCRRQYADVLVVEELAVISHDSAFSSHWRAAKALAPVCVSHHAYWWPA